MKITVTIDPTTHLGHVLNPYSRNRDLEENEMWKDHAKEWPELLVYSTDGTQLLEGKDLECILIFQTEPQDEDYFEWRDCDEATFSFIEKNNKSKKFLNRTPIRKIYRALPQKEEKEAEENRKAFTDHCEEIKRLFEKEETVEEAAEQRFPYTNYNLGPVESAREKMRILIRRTDFIDGAKYDHSRTIKKVVEILENTFPISKEVLTDLITQIKELK